MSEREWTPLTAVACVLRVAAPSVGALPHVTKLLDELLDVTVLLTLEAAVVVGSERLVKRVLRRVLLLLDSPLPGRLEAEIALGIAIQAAVAQGRLDFVEGIHRVHPGPLSTRLLLKAARHGDVAMLRWLLTHRTDGLCVPHPVEEDTMTRGRRDCCLRKVYIEALDHNQHIIIRWLFERGYIHSIESAGDTAAGSGDLDMVRWVHARNQPNTFTSAALNSAAREGHLAVVRFLVENRSEQSTIFGLNAAIHAGHDEIVSLLRKKIVIVGNNDLGMTVIHAADTGRLDLIKSLPRSDDDPRWHYEFAMYAAAAKGHKHVIEWIIDELRVPLPLGARVRAASHGQLSVLKWAHAQEREEWGVDVMNSAAAENQLTVVQWLHENRSDGCSTAAMSGAAANGHLEMVQWLHVNRREGCTAEAMNGAAVNGHLGVIQWLHTNRSEGCTTEAMDEAAESGHLEVVKWLHCHRTEGCTTRAMDGAARGGHLPVLEFLHEHRSEGCSWQAAVAAAISGHRHIVDWLRQTYPLVYDAARVADATT